MQHFAHTIKRSFRLDELSRQRSSQQIHDCLSLSTSISRKGHTARNYAERERERAEAERKRRRQRDEAADSWSTRVTGDDACFQLFHSAA